VNTAPSEQINAPELSVASTVLFSQHEIEVSFIARIIKQAGTLNNRRKTQIILAIHTKNKQAKYSSCKD
jgi:hypothetical protein